MDFQPLEFSSLAQSAESEDTSSDRLVKLASMSVQLARIVASNPAATPRLLGQLANHADIIIRQNIAANPNTPTEVLFQLGKNFPGQLLSNPIFSIWFLENPNFFHKIPIKTVQSLLDYNLKQLDTVGDRKNLIDTVFLQILANHHNHQMSAIIAKYPYTPVELLEKLASNGGGKTLEYVLVNPNTPAYILEKYTKFRSSTFVSLAARNPNMPTYLLERYAEDESWNIRAAVASNLKTPELILQKMAQVPLQHRRVLLAIAGNPNTSIEVLKQLAGDRREKIREVAIKNLNNLLKKP